ncbi:MAG: hypothetical protein IJZ55_06610 [Lachnospiraceae bacterium]|nr:hypothetical protein [Lachnospiraceae bacterium]
MSVRERITEEQIAKYTELVTPKKKLRKKGGKMSIIFFLCCFAFGILLGVGLGFLEEKGVSLSLPKPFSIKEGLEFVYGVLLIVGLFVMMVVHTAIHEAGHLVFGLWTGYEFLSYRVFSFTIVKKDGKLMYKKLKVPGTLGQCLMMPPEWKEDAPYPYVWYNLGGGILNIVTSLAVAPLFFLNNPLLGWIAGVFIFDGVIFGLTNLLPMTVGLPNDGKNCLLCKKDRMNQKAFYLQLKLNMMMSDGVTAKDLSDELLCVGQEFEINSLTCYIRLMEFLKHLQKKEDAEARACLAEIEKNGRKLPVAFLNTIELQRMYCMILDKAPIEEIAAYYAVLQPVLIQVKDISILLIKYVFYLCLTEEERETIEWLIRSKKGKLPKRLPTRKPVKAEKIFEEMEKAYAKYPVIGEAEIYMDLAKYCKERYEAE